MTDPPYVLHDEARTVVRDAIVELCREKDWALLSLHVRTNHVHAVVSADREPGRLMSELKSRASRDLNRTGTDTNAKRWTRHGSTRHLFDETSVTRAIDYTLNQQGTRMAFYDAQKAAHEVIALCDASPPLTLCAAPCEGACRCDRTHPVVDHFADVREKVERENEVLQNPDKLEGA